MEFKNYEMTVSKMTCSNCEKGILNQLKEVSSIKKAEINLLYEKLYVTASSDYDINKISTELEKVNKKVNNIKEIRTHKESIRTLKLLTNEAEEIENTLKGKLLGIVSINKNKLEGESKKLKDNTNYKPDEKESALDRLETVLLCSCHVLYNLCKILRAFFLQNIFC